VRVEVWSDVVCPWCRVGKARFEEALARLGWDGVEVVQRPFELPHKPGRPHPSTFDAHRLLAWALAEHGWRVQAALAGRLMDAWSDERADVADHAVLARLAAEVGLDADAASTVLATGAFADEVRAGEAEAAARDIYAVPTFVVDGGFAIPGAQDVDTFVSLLERLAERGS
jgi:predicted DsbA family dithiol-disulfide isomerase